MSGDLRGRLPLGFLGGQNEPTDNHELKKLAEKLQRIHGDLKRFITNDETPNKVDCRRLEKLLQRCQLYTQKDVYEKLGSDTRKQYLSDLSDLEYIVREKCERGESRESRDRHRHDRIPDGGLDLSDFHPPADPVESLRDMGRGNMGDMISKLYKVRIENSSDREHIKVPRFLLTPEDKGLLRARFDILHAQLTQKDLHDPAKCVSVPLSEKLIEKLWMVDKFVRERAKYALISVLKWQKTLLMLYVVCFLLVVGTTALYMLDRDPGWSAIASVLSLLGAGLLLAGLILAFILNKHNVTMNPRDVTGIVTAGILALVMGGMSFASYVWPDQANVFLITTASLMFVGVGVMFAMRSGGRIGIRGAVKFTMERYSGANMHGLSQERESVSRGSAVAEDAGQAEEVGKSARRGGMTVERIGGGGEGFGGFR
jgi:hypothetical protein